MTASRAADLTALTPAIPAASAMRRRIKLPVGLGGASLEFRVFGQLRGRDSRRDASLSHRSAADDEARKSAACASRRFPPPGRASSTRRSILTGSCRRSCTSRRVSCQEERGAGCDDVNPPLRVATLLRWNAWRAPGSARTRSRRLAGRDSFRGAAEACCCPRGDAGDTIGRCRSPHRSQPRPWLPGTRGVS